jgi:hypothetical protein
MKNALLCLALYLVLGVALFSALAQSRDVVVAPSDADAVVNGARVDFLPDGGCALTPLVQGAVAGVVAVNPATRGFGGAHPAVCNALQVGALRAYELDVGVGDGGAP